MRWVISRLVYRYFLKPIAFSFSPDTMHEWATKVGWFLGKWTATKFAVKIFYKFEHEKLNQTLAGIDIKNPVGLAAGFDKDAYILASLPSVGFGFSSVGTVTNNFYEGNPKPWATRLLESRALTVNYGLKNEGVDKVLLRIKQSVLPSDYKFGVSIGKTNNQYTIEEQKGIDDYVASFKKVQGSQIGDWYEINISCPNTFGGEPFTSPDRLRNLLRAIFAEKPDKPVFVKMPINLPWNEFKVLTDICLEFGVKGLIIGNLNKDRTDLSIRDIIPEAVKGGISGKPTEKLSNELISQTFAYAGDKILIIGVGGIFSADDAYEKIKRGASLVQLITGMIYEGPQLIGEINKGLVDLIEKDGYSSIEEAVGSYTK